MWSYIATIVFALLGAFMIFIILLQRGRGGGLAGAFGGLGGQSAFGTKAGDVFTKITVVIAVVWVAMAGITGWAHLSEWEGRYAEDPDVPAVKATEGTPVVPTEPAEGTQLTPGTPPTGATTSSGEPADDQPVDASAAGEQPPAQSPSESLDDSDTADSPPANPGNP